MVNKVILIGRLGQDPATRFTPGGTQVCNFTLATNENFKDKSGQWQKRTEWHRIVAWAGLAERCSQILKKGYALLELNEREKGVEVLRSLVEKFSGTEEAKWAQARLERLGERVDR